MYFRIALCSYLASLLTFVLFLVFNFINYKKETFKTFNVKNMMPFEILEPNKNRFVSAILLFVSAFFSILFYVLSLFIYQQSFIYFIGVAGIVVAILLVFLFFLTFSNLRLYTVFLTLFISLLLFLNVALCVNGYLANSRYHEMLFSGIFSSVIGVIILLLTMDPKFSYNEKMVINDKGEYERPKLYHFAFSQWILILLYYLSGISLLSILIETIR